MSHTTPYPRDRAPALTFPVVNGAAFDLSAISREAFTLCSSIAACTARSARTRCRSVAVVDPDVRIYALSLQNVPFAVRVSTISQRD